MLTTEEWLERARGGQEVTSCLAHAERAARRPDDWITLASAWMELAEVASARRCIETALERAQGEHWPSRRAAEFLLNRLEDREAAAVALGRIEARLLSPTRDIPTRAYQWVLLAQAYQEVLGQTDSVHRCLASAAAGASTPDDLTALARGYRQLRDDLGRARDLLERAERLGLERGALRELWGVAVEWKSLHDDARARAALELATARASDLPTLTSLTVAWESLFHDEEAMRGALVRAESLATSPDDWLVLAEGYRDGGQGERESTWDSEGVRRCLETALTTTPAPTGLQRERIAAAFQRWLGDSARASELVPQRPSLEERVRPLRHIEGWAPREPLALLHRLRARMRPEDLEFIANADYGNDRSKHHQALLEIHAADTFPLPLDWHPREVLELTRWSQGADHAVRRAFACTVLVLDAVLPDSLRAAEVDTTLPVLLETAWTLGLEDELEQLLVWLVEVIAWEDACSWSLFALVLTLAHRASGDPRIGPLVAELQKREGTDSDVRALVRMGRGMMWDRWSPLIDELLDPETGLPPHLEWLAIHLR